MVYLDFQVCGLSRVSSVWFISSFKCVVYLNFCSGFIKREVYFVNAKLFALVWDNPPEFCYTVSKLKSGRLNSRRPEDYLSSACARGEGRAPFLSLVFPQFDPSN